MRSIYFLMVLFWCTAFLQASDSIVQSEVDVSRKDTLAVTDSLSTERVITQEAPPLKQFSPSSCSLNVITKPSGVQVVFDSKEYGLSPVLISNVDTGKHTLLLQKSGYFQKKVRISLPEPKMTSIEITLSKPGHLAIVSFPESASVTINGNHSGFTPYSNSAIKPGTYHIVLTKEKYLPVNDTVVITGGDTVSIVDTLLMTDLYRDSVATAVSHATAKKSHLHYSIIGGLFGIFLLVVGIIELQEK